MYLPPKSFLFIFYQVLEALVVRGYLNTHTNLVISYPGPPMVLTGICVHVRTTLLLGYLYLVVPDKRCRR